MAGPLQPSPFGSSTDPALAEAAAHQLTSASLAGYGALPNPQAVFEAIRTGGTSTLSAAFQEGNPLFESALAGTPAGAAQAATSPYSQATPALTDPNQTLWSPLRRNLHDELGQDHNAGWRAFGDLPALSFSWMNSVRQGGAGSIRKWQQLLKDKGFIDPKTNYQVSGVWDQTSEAALQGFMISWATPQALFGQDPQTRGQATMFLHGLGFDPNAISSSDPTRLSQIAQQWMATLGPDAQQGSKSELQQYADQFGTSALPQSYQALIQNGFFQTIRDGLSSLPLIGDIPGVGGLYHGAVNALTGNLDLGHLSDDPRKVRAEQIKKGLSAADQANLAPALQAVQDDAGFLGFLDDYDHGRTKFLLASMYTLGDLFTGKFEGHRDNPFDAMSGVNLTAQAHQDNMFAGIFGDQAAQDNPAWAGLFNFAANIADDPTSYIPLLGELEMVGKARGIRTVARAIGKDEARAAFHQLSGDTIRERVNDGFFRAMRSPAFQARSYGDADFAQAFGLSGMGGEHDLSALRLVRKIMDPATDEGEARHLMLEGDGVHDGFGWMIHTGKGVYNARAAWESLAQVKSAHVLGKARAVGSFEELPDHFMRSNPIATAQFLRHAAIVAQVPAADIRPLLDAYTKAAVEDPNNVMAPVHKIEDAIKQAYHQLPGVRSAGGEDALRTWIGRHRGGRSLVGGGRGLEDRVNMYAPHRLTGKETSLATKETDPALAREAEKQIHGLEAALHMAQEEGVGPEGVAVLQAKLADLQRPVPMLETQLADQYHFPYSLYEMVAFKNPVLRNVERVQAGLKADAVLSMWKRITIGRISSALRIDFGDDMIRPALMMVGLGHPTMAAKYLVQSTAGALGLLVPGARKRVLANLVEKIDRNPQMQSILQEMSKILQEGNTNVHHAIAPDGVGYAKGLEYDITNHFARSEIAQAWLAGDTPEAAKQAVRSLAESDAPQLKAWRQAQDPSGDRLDEVVDRFHDWMAGYFRNPQIREWARKGAVNKEALRRLVREQGNRADSTLPGFVFARLNNPYANSTVQRWATKFPDAVFEHLTKPMIDIARINGAMKMQGLYEQQIRNYFRGRPGRQGAEFEAMVRSASVSRAIDWIANNTYQGTRNVMGGMVRNVFPFYGATQNMDRFYLRQAAASPFVGSAVMHTALSSQQAQSPTQSNAPGLDVSFGALAHLGFGGGEGLTLNPMHAFFLTSDGIGSMVPGTGPLFAPLWAAASHNPAFAQLLADVIPGAKQQIDYNTGQAKPMFPWLADLVSGVSLMAGGGGDVPVLGRSKESIDRDVDAKVQQRERESGRAVTPEELGSIRRELGLDLAGQAAASFTIPMAPQVKDVAGAAQQAGMDQWRQAPDDAAKDTVLTGALGIKAAEWTAALSRQPGAPTVADLIRKNPQSPAALMAYEDKRVSPEERDAVAEIAPWVVSAGTSKYSRTGDVPGAPTFTPDLAQWQLMRHHGDINLLGPEQFVAQIQSERDVNQGWLEYDGLKNLEYETIQQNGWAASSEQFRAWKAAVLNPAIIALQDTHPSWWAKFGGAGGTTAPDLAGATRSLRSLQTWEVIPQHSDYENQQSVLWRNALVFRDQAAAQLYSLHANHASKAEQDLVMQGLQQQLQSLAAQDPRFAAQLGRFRFGTWEDVVSLQADELQAGQYLGGVA